MKHKTLNTTALIVGAIALTSTLTATSYTSDSNIADFTTGIAEFAKLSNFGGGDVASPYTPTASSIANHGYRVYGGGAVSGLSGGNWILADFTSPVASIRVFPNIDHLGSQYDGFQYSIWGKSASGAWVSLFDALTVTGSGEPFTLGTFTGTAPTVVNNVLTPGTGPAGTVGYEADFTFSSAYSEYAFGASTVAVKQGNADQELSAVGSTVPEPSTTAGLIAIGVAGLLIRGRKWSK
jgi:hypothetical protein